MAASALKSTFGNTARSARYFVESLGARKHHGGFSETDFGVCSVCGRFSRFFYREVIKQDSFVAQSCRFDEIFRKVVNITNSFLCSFCRSRYRVRCAARSLLDFFWPGKIHSMAQLVRQMNSGNIHEWTVLETGSRNGLFTLFGNPPGAVFSEYFDDVPNGSIRNGIYSEDLEKLGFESETFDALIALDVFEHIADPWKAFKEVVRVLKPAGRCFLTVPIDPRNLTTRTIASRKDGKIFFNVPPAYHLDPLREKALVYTEFGMDIFDRLRGLGYEVFIDRYSFSGATQFVIMLQGPRKE